MSVSDSAGSPESAILYYSRILAGIGLIGLITLALATMADVLMRWLFNSPIYGMSDLAELVTPAIVASCFPAALAARQNITIRFLGRALPPRLGQAVELFGQSVALLVFVGIAVELGRYSFGIWSNNQFTWLLRVPVWPTWVLTAVLLFLCVPIQVLVVLQTARAMREGKALSAEHADGG